MKKSPLWQHGLIVLLVCGVGVFGQTDNAGNPARATGAHAGIDCTQCHGLVASLDGSAAIVPPDQRCRSCHGAPAGDDLRFQQAFHRDDSRSCADCHLFHDPGMIALQGRTLNPARSGGPASCVACHDDRGSMDNLSEGHRIAAALYHSNDPVLSGLSASQTCLVCHAEDQTVKVNGLELTNVPQFSRHGMHPIGVVKARSEMREGARKRPVFDPRIRLYDNRIECHTCHQLTGVAKNRLMDLGSPEALCRACHQFE